ncbi:unnamed protein product [Oikopleura dioica]|uniref:Uncharacterized protein n=1 Tax=Oikopleura dioica TaxID=34765 RepID=E4YX30_OIKDI|nr:unnamed protein product [Oikopleura dioica]
MLNDKRKRSRIDSAIEESGGIEKVLLATKQLTPTPEANETKGRLLISGPVAGSVTKNGRAFNYKPPVEISQKKVKSLFFMH